MRQKQLVQKASGALEPFDPNKLRQSLQHVGAAPHVIDRILAALQQDWQEGTSTQVIYQRAFQLLRERSQHAAARYRLKNALLELGPSGYPFERYIGALFQAEGWACQVGKIMQGRCVQHEVDVIAEKTQALRLAECKYHSAQSNKSDVKIALYVSARMRDLREALQAQPNGHQTHFEGWLVTNTRFTEDAIQYGQCAGLHLLSWDYPQGQALKDKVNALQLHPITCLSALADKDKQWLLDRGIVLAKQLAEDRHWQQHLGLSKHKQKQLEAELRGFCTT